MIKRLFSFGLVVVLVVNVMSFSLIQLNFNLNRDFISKTLCINKDDVSSNCQGKCYLTKQLKEDKKSKNKKSPDDLAGKQINLFFQKYPGPKMKLLRLSGNLFGWIQTVKSLRSGFVDQLELPPENDFVYA